MGILQYVLQREHKEFSGIAWSDLDGWGCYNMVLEFQFSKLSLDGPRKLS
jgi:hypothetical protein